MGNFLWELKIQISGTTVVTKVHEFVLHLEKKMLNIILLVNSLTVSKY